MVIKDNSLTVEKKVYPNTTIHPIHDRRRLVLYTLTENELETISYNNTLSIVSFSVGSFFLSESFSYFKSNNFSAIFFCFLGFSILAFINGLISFKQKKGITDKVKKSHVVEDVHVDSNGV